LLDNPALCIAVCEIFALRLSVSGLASEQMIQIRIRSPRTTQRTLATFLADFFFAGGFGFGDAGALMYASTADSMMSSRVFFPSFRQYGRSDHHPFYLPRLSALWLVDSVSWRVWSFFSSFLPS